jgi:hypothetical protein
MLLFSDLDKESFILFSKNPVINEVSKNRVLLLVSTFNCIVSLSNSTSPVYVSKVAFMGKFFVVDTFT